MTALGVPMTFHGLTCAVLASVVGDFGSSKRHLGPVSLDLQKPRLLQPIRRLCSSIVLQNLCFSGIFILIIILTCHTWKQFFCLNISSTTYQWPSQFTFPCLFFMYNEFQPLVSEAVCCYRLKPIEGRTRWRAASREHNDLQHWQCTVHWSRCGWSQDKENICLQMLNLYKRMLLIVSLMNDMLSNQTCFQSIRTKKYDADLWRMSNRNEIIEVSGQLKASHIYL